MTNDYHWTKGEIRFYPPMSGGCYLCLKSDTKCCYLLDEVQEKINKQERGECNGRDKEKVANGKRGIFETP